MKLKNNKGFSGVDVTISLLIIIMFVSIIVTLSYNFSLSAKRVERKGEALYITVQILEQLKKQDYDTVYSGMTVDNVNISKGYNVNIDVKSYEEYILETKGETVEEGQIAPIKIITVTVEYKVGKTIEKLEISTIIVNTNA